MASSGDARQQTNMQMRECCFDIVISISHTLKPRRAADPPSVSVLRCLARCAGRSWPIAIAQGQGNKGRQASSYSKAHHGLKCLGRVFNTVRDGVLEIGFWDSPALISYLDLRNRGIARLNFLSGLRNRGTGAKSPADFLKAISKAQNLTVPPRPDYEG